MTAACVIVSTDTILLLPSPSMPPSNELKQSFRTVAVWAAVLVVLIHYRSAGTLAEGINGWAQEAVVNGIARVAVPLFAFAAGFFYFLSATGTPSNYWRKLRQRVRTLLIPYLLTSLFAFSCWSMMQLMTGRPTQLAWSEIAARVILHPMAEQLWFLRDLFVLVIAAPIIQWFVHRAPRLTLGMLAVLWALELQPAPLIAGWYALNLETLLFFAIGCWCVAHVCLLERLIRADGRRCVLLAVISGLLLSVRITIDPTFDLWYVREFSTPSLLLQKGMILVGCLLLLSLARHAHSDRWNRLSEFSFFVYLIHEFPLRELLQRLWGTVVGSDLSFWFAGPTAVVCSFSMAFIAARCTPRLLAILTGGRTQRRVPLAASETR